MMDWTDRHDRYFLRLISREALLYTEMVTSAALMHGDVDRLLAFNRDEHPVAVQLGGSDPEELARCAKICEQYGYDEINLNVGCPSDRVQQGKIGACLMAEPELVADCLKAMQDAVAIPVTVKHRLGIDELESWEFLVDFVGRVAESGCQTFIVHARKAILSGLSPKQNREIPPLDYPRVYQLKQTFPQLEIIINGGIKTLEEVEAHLLKVDGAMMGREAYHNPYILADVDRLFYDSQSMPRSRIEVAEAFIRYAEGQLQKGVRLQNMTRHILGLFHGQPGGRLWRRILSEKSPRKGAGVEVIVEALQAVLEQKSPHQVGEID